MRKLATILLLVVLACTMSPISGSANDLYTISSDGPYTNGSWSFGNIFTVGSQNITVTTLGAYDDSGNGFVSGGGIPVGIYRESDQTLLASTNVTSGDPLSGYFRFKSIAPLTLQSGEQYRVVAVSLSDNYNAEPNTFSFDPLVTFNGFGYGLSSTLAFSNYQTGIDYTWMANLQFNPTNSAPEPATMLLLGLGLVGLAGVRRKFKQ